jgi:glycine cleavage system H lipoate-binding protein
MQYCAAASVTRFIPYSESLVARCGNDGHRYCHLYLAMAHPTGAHNRPPEEVDGIALPASLHYSANHLWIDLSEDGTCHAGIDAFLSRVLGPVERIAYIRQQGYHRPAAILTAGGLDWEIVFPNPMLLTGCNLYLRASPGRLTAEPYTSGWLFEGVPQPETTRNLLHGAEARCWMEQEERRINEFLQQQATPRQTAADGGLFAPAIASHLGREPMLALFHEFFSPLARETDRSKCER